MTKIINLFIVILALTIGSPGLADARSFKPIHPKLTTRSGLLERHKEFIAVTARGDAGEMARLVAEDYLVTGTDGQKADKASALAAVRRNGAGVEMADSEVEARLVGGAGVVTGLIRWKAGTGEHEVRGSVRYTEVWRRKANGWELVAAQATNVQEK
ncbi:MAG: nuclear transport factor 2 family protein [Blastocatellia bacterium]